MGVCHVIEPTGLYKFICSSDGFTWHSDGSTASLADRPSAADFGVGVCQVGGVIYGSDGSTWSPITKSDNNVSVALARYRAIPNSTARKIAWVGDSTTNNLFASGIGGKTSVLEGSNINTSYGYVFSYPGGPFFNVTHGNFGANGASLSTYLQDAAGSGKNLSDIVAFDPDLIVFCYGINDVRLGLTDKSTLKARIQTAISQYRDQIPNADIILRMPNSLLYDAANANSYIDAPVSLAKVQGYSDILRESYLELIGVIPGVYILDIQTGAGQVFPQTVATLANKGFYMSDALHPNGEGGGAIVREVLKLLGDYEDIRFARHDQHSTPLLDEFSKYQSYNATNVSSTLDYLYYPRVCEDASKYNLILDGIFVTGTAGSFVDISGKNGIAANVYSEVVKQNDIIVQYSTPDTTSGSQGESIENGVVAWKYTGNTVFDQASNVRLLSCPAGYPHSQILPNTLRVYRPRPTTQKQDYDPNPVIVLSQSDFTAGTLSTVVQKFSVIGSIVGVSATAVTTGGTVDIKKNGTTIATLTWANAATVPTYSGTFFTTNTRGAYFDEGDILEAVINAGFVDGTYPKITLSNH